VSTLKTHRHPQRRIDPPLPPRPALAKLGKHVRVDPQCYLLLSLSRLPTTRYMVPTADLAPIESEFATDEEVEAYDAWFRAKVEKAMTSTAPASRTTK